MSVRSRWVRPPAELRRQLDGNERVLALADTADAVVAATNLGLLLPHFVDGVPSWRRIGWDRIVKATWTETGLRLVEGELDEVGVVTDLPPVAVTLVVPRNLPNVVRTRVETSIARSEQVRVPGGTARLIARRIPGVDGVTWTARLDTGTPEAPSARAALVHYLTQARTAAAE